MTKIALTFISTLILISCNDSHKEFKKRILQCAAEYNAVIREVETVSHSNAVKIMDLIEQQNSLDLSIENMNLERGGKYSLFNGRQYYKVNDDGLAAVLVTVGRGDSPEQKKTIRLLEYVQPQMKELSKPYFSQAILMGNHVAFLYPWVDLISTIPPELDYKKIFWYYLAGPVHNPEKKTVWSGEPFALLSTYGWCKNVMSPIYHQEQYLGTSNCDLLITPLGELLFKPYESDYIMLITKDTKVLAASKALSERFSIKVLTQKNYLELMHKNIFVEDFYRLTYPENPDDIKVLGEKIKSETEFKIKLAGKRWFVYTKPLDSHPDLIITGLFQN